MLRSYGVGTSFDQEYSADEYHLTCTEDSVGGGIEDLIDGRAIKCQGVGFSSLVDLGITYNAEKDMLDVAVMTVDNTGKSCTRRLFRNRARL